MQEYTTLFANGQYRDGANLGGALRPGPQFDL
jgi:hypothetical protein